jgi:hypothetical protein
LSTGTTFLLATSKEIGEPFSFGQQERPQPGSGGADGHPGQEGLLAGQWGDRAAHPARQVRYPRHVGITSHSEFSATFLATFSPNLRHQILAGPPTLHVQRDEGLGLAAYQTFVFKEAPGKGKGRGGTCAFPDLAGVFRGSS